LWAIPFDGGALLDAMRDGTASHPRFT